MLKIQTKTIIHLLFVGTIVTHSSAMDQCNKKTIFSENQQESIDEKTQEILKSFEKITNVKTNFSEDLGMFIQKSPQKIDTLIKTLILQVYRKKIRDVDGLKVYLPKIFKLLAPLTSRQIEPIVEFFPSLIQRMEPFYRVSHFVEYLVSTKSENIQFLLNEYMLIANSFSWECSLSSGCVFPVISPLKETKTKWLFEVLTPLIKERKWDERHVSNILKFVAPLKKKKTTTILKALSPLILEFKWDEYRMTMHFKAFSEIESEKIESTAQVLEPQMKKFKWDFVEKLVPIVASMSVKKAEQVFDILTPLIIELKWSPTTTAHFIEARSTLEAEELRMLADMLISTHK